MTTPVGTPSYTELVAALRGEGESLLAAAGLGLDMWVPTCEEWNVEALVLHVAGIYCYAAGLVHDRATQPPDAKPEPSDGPPLEVLRGALDDLVDALTDSEPDTPVWNWSEREPHTATFWARRMAHESSIHRYDAQAAHELAQPIDAELARDGMDELIDVLASRVYRRDGVTGPSGTVALESTDDGTWYVELAPDTVRRGELTSSPDATARASTSVLLLAAYGRLPWSWSSIELSGDVELLEKWRGAMRF